MQLTEVLCNAVSRGEARVRACARVCVCVGGGGGVRACMRAWLVADISNKQAGGLYE
jgi:hypothetical protein